MELETVSTNNKQSVFEKSLKEFNETLVKKEESIQILNIDESQSVTEQDLEYKFNTTKLCQWQSHGFGSFSPCTKTQHIIPAGVYQPAYSNTIGVYLKNTIFRTDELLNFPDLIYMDIINSIKSFWSKKPYYDKYSFTYKRGILLYGQPGCGKSCIISQCMSHLIKNIGGIVVNIANNDQLQFYSELLPQIREIEKDRPIITILEDLDVLAQRRVSAVLNLLDGIKQVDNIIYIATTNHPEELEERILNRPSRFDRRFHIGTPAAEVRRFYFQNKIKSEDLKKIDIKKWVEKTDGFSIAHLKELIISVFVLEYTFEYALSQLDSMMNTSGIKKCTLNKQTGIGF